MKRKLFNIAAILSMVMCVATAGLWVRSYWVADFVSYTRNLNPGFWQLSVDSVQRSIHLGYFSSPASLRADDITGLRREVMSSNKVEVMNDHFGFGFEPSEIWFPHLLVVFLSTILPVRAFILHRRLRNRVANNLCLNCGYDLRGSPDRCPECGTDVHAAASTTSLGPVDAGKSPG